MPIGIASASAISRDSIPNFERIGHALGDVVEDGGILPKRITEVATHKDAADPIEVLDVDRLV